jgi:hypothetical protein
MSVAQATEIQNVSHPPLRPKYGCFGLKNPIMLLLTAFAMAGK